MGDHKQPTIRTFAYSGNKRRLLPLYAPPPEGTRVICEPFAGSLAYSLHHAPRIGAKIVAAEKDWRIRELYTAFRHDGDRALASLRQTIAAVLALPDHADVKPIVADGWLRFLVQVSCCGMFRGGSTSTCYYAQFAGSLRALEKNMTAAAPFLALVEGVADDFLATAQYDHPAVCFFIDPPYLDTDAGYGKGGRGLDVRAFRELLGSLVSSPVLVTYGDGADAVAQLPWARVATRKVARLHSKTGGTADRGEFAAYLRWR